MFGYAQATTIIGADMSYSTLNTLSALERAAWALEHLPSTHVVSTSFGAQAAVMLHLLTQIKPDIDVILVDTGYLFEETYRFADELTARLKLNVKVYEPAISSAWSEAKYGPRWNMGAEELERYNHVHKVEPLQRALRELGVGTWFTGRRRNQATSRADLRVVEEPTPTRAMFKVNPVIDWTDRDVGQYLAQHQLPYHPLWHEGYISIGDIHSTRRWEPGMDVEAVRFDGVRRECGIHLI